MGKSEELVHTLLQTYKGQVQLIYLDPPFCTGDTFSIQIGGHTKSAYTDTLSLDCYLQMMRSILSGCFDLLHPHGCLYLHADYRASAHLKILMDDIFGADHFMNEIIWAYQSGGRSTKHFSRKHDNILLYRKSRQCYFNIAAVGKPRGPDKRNHMKRSVNSDGRVLYSIRSGSKEYVYTEEQLVYPSDVWSDISHLHQRNPERNGYATQKPEALLKRILLASSRPGDIVADFFSGSGTTAAVARKTGRYFIGVDSSPYALYTLRRRLADGLPHKQVLLHFPASTLQVRLDYEKHQQAQETVIRLNGVESMNASGGILCCALGYVQNDTFHPIHHVDKPVFPALLSMPAQYAPVVRLTDLEGKQGFYSV